MSGRFFAGTLLLLAGVLLFFSSIGAIPLGFWHNLFSLWPLLLIALGLRMIFRKGLLALLSPLVLVLMVVWALVMPSGYFGRSEDVSYRQTLDDSVTEARLVVSTGAAELRLRGTGPDSTDLISATERTYGWPTDFTYRLYGSEAVVSATRSSRSFFGFSVNGFRVGSSRIEAALNTSIPWSIELNTGASSVRMDLADIVVHRLDINGGVNSVNVQLGARADRTRVDISGGLASINLTVPREVGVRIDTDSAFVGQNFKASGFQKNNGVWLSENYDTASKFIDISLQGGLSSFKIHFSNDRGVTL